MLSKIKDSYHEGMSVIITNPTYYALVSILEMIIMIVIVYVWSPFGISEKYPALGIIFILFFGCFQVITFLFVKNKDILKEKGVQVKPTFSDISIKVIFTIVTICVSVLFMYILFWIITNVSSIGQLFIYMVDAMIIFGGMALIYKSFLYTQKEKKENETKNILSLIGAFIMYIPCALIDFIEWLKFQYEITTKTVWLILGAEMIFIALRILLPKIMTFFVNMNGTQLLRDPVYLDTRHTLGTYEILHENKVMNGAYKYSISAWFWINPQPVGTRPSYTKYTNILEFGKQPAVEYNALKNNLRVTCHIKGDNTVTIFETNEIKYQTWNNIVINYDGATMDVFLNGFMVGSKPNIAPYVKMENVIVGDIKGVEGGICNVMFYRNILHQRQILMLYKTLKGMSTPLL
jgi:hypothetical protein